MIATRHLAAFHLHAFDRVTQSAVFLDQWNHGPDDAVDLATRVLGRPAAYLRPDFAS